MSKPLLFMPKFGRRVRHPDGSLFAGGGEPISLNSFYRRLIADGDLVPAQPAKNPAPVKRKRTSRSAQNRPAKKGPSS